MTQTSLFDSDQLFPPATWAIYKARSEEIVANKEQRDFLRSIFQKIRAEIELLNYLEVN